MKKLILSCFGATDDKVSLENREWHKNFFNSLGNEKEIRMKFRKKVVGF
jgi:hypothetical protein